MIAGDEAVGKSAITQVFHSDGKHFPEKYNMTTSVEYCTRVCEIAETSDSVEIHIIDSAGQDAFQEIAQQMWTDASFFVFVYDVTNPKSFGSIKGWVEKARATFSNPRIPCALLANKTDLTKLRAITPEQGLELAESLGMPHYEVSAKTGADIEKAFDELAIGHHRRYEATVSEIISAALE